MGLGWAAGHLLLRRGRPTGNLETMGVPCPGRSDEGRTLLSRRESDRHGGAIAEVSSWISDGRPGFGGWVALRRGPRQNSTSVRYPSQIRQRQLESPSTSCKGNSRCWNKLSAQRASGRRPAERWHAICLSKDVFGPLRTGLALDAANKTT